METALYVAVVPGYGDYHKKLNLDGHDLRGDIARDAVTAYDLTSERDNPKTVHVEVYEIVTKSGSLIRIPLAGIDILPPPRPLEAFEYQCERERLTRSLPNEFHDFVNEIVGASSNLDEHIDRITEVVAGLKRAINAYDKRPVNDGY